VLDQSKHADQSSETYSITALSNEFDVTTRTIRFYEDQGLISPERKGRTRIYSVRDRIRLKLVLRGKRLGFSLGEIAEIIDLYDTEPGEAAQLEFFLNKIAERTTLLKQQKKDIEITLKELRVIEKQCRERLKQL